MKINSWVQIPSLFLICMIPSFCLPAREGGRFRGKGGQERREGPKGVFLTAIPEYKGNVILGRPTDRSITLSVMVQKNTRARIVYGNGIQTELFDLKAGVPREIVLDHLNADALYHYRISNSESGELLFEGTFQTCRKPGNSFTFTVQADSHLDENCEPELYKICLANAMADKPDFHIDLGDTFMTGKHESRETAALQYRAQRYYLGLIGHSVPVFLVLGNHDGEEAGKPGATDSDGLAIWSCQHRKTYFPNPVPSPFYSGNKEKFTGTGLLQNYYAWNWGDALFVVLDPYWTSKSTRGWTEPWNMSIGKTQYDWLKETLRHSKAKFKFVFIHQLTGGIGKGGRGGGEAAPFYEWGGHEKDGRNTFKMNRPGWEKPIHDLLVESKVTIVFHGHDHFFAKQELDGVIYQLVPQPCQRNSRNDQAEEYGYEKGVFLPSSGYLRIEVSSSRATVNYMSASLRNENVLKRGNGACVYSYRCSSQT